MIRLVQIRYAAVLALITLAGGTALADDAGVSPRPFDITLPPAYGDFVRQVQTAPSPEGSIVTTTWVSRAPTAEAVIVTMSTMPAKILDAKKLIASTRTSLLHSLGATLESEQARDDDTTSTRLLFKTDTAYFRARFTVASDRLYQLLYVGRSAEQRAGASVGEAFASFQIKPVLDPIAARVP